MKKSVSYFLTAVIAIVPLVAFFQRQAIFDWWRLREYTPSAEIVRLADNIKMTEEGRRLFYVYHAELQEAEEFNQSCQFSEKSIVLGCYVSSSGIYIYNVTDERLAGVKEVTAAHEVLHAAYDRLSSSERTKIDALTQQVLQDSASQRIKDTVEAYRQRDPGIVSNELHSIVGTEIRTLPDELEKYYAQYFTDRSAVVSYAEKYEQAFTERLQRADVLSEQIQSLKTQIKNNESLLATLRQQLEAEFRSLESQRSHAEPSSFNALVRSYNEKVRQYNVLVQRSYALIDQHNALVAEYNQVVLEEKELIKAIDSRPETIDTE